MTSPVRKTPQDYTVGWISPLADELVASSRMLDEEHAPLHTVDTRDQNIYRYGSMCGHNVVMAGLKGGEGLSQAALIASEMWYRFSDLRFLLLDGIGGAVPSSEHDIRLGDVVVSKPNDVMGGVVHWDHGKDTVDGLVRKGTLNKPPGLLRGAIEELDIRTQLGRSTLSENIERGLISYQYPSNEPDHLFSADYTHTGDVDCSQCDSKKTVTRPPRSTRPTIFAGNIGSGTKVMKNGAHRDEVSASLGGILCFEMEAAGLMDDFPCLVIRGVSDYSDSHKNDGWRKYAASTAAACAREVLTIVTPLESQALPSIAANQETLNRQWVCASKNLRVQRNR